MGDPAPLTPDEQEITLAIATEIVAAVRADKEGPLELPDFTRATSRGDMLNMLKNWWGEADLQMFRLAQYTVDSRRALNIACDKLEFLGKLEVIGNPELATLAAQLRMLDIPEPPDDDDEPAPLPASPRPRAR